MVRFAKVAQLAEELAGEAGRLKKRAAIAAAIRAVHEAEPEGEDAGRFAMYLAGEPFAEADGRKLNAGGALLSKALLAVSGASGEALTAAYRRHGDLGAAGFDLLAAGRRGNPTHGDKTAMDGAPDGLRPAADEAHVPGAGHGAPGSGAGSTGDLSFGSSLTLEEVAAAFAGMAVAKTTAIRAGLVEGLLRRASPLEAKYLLKLMLGDMRIGVKQSLVEEAIAVAASEPTSEDPDVGHPVSVKAVRRAVMLEADLAGAVRRAFAGTLEEARMRLFHPLGFMLASPVETPEEAVERFTEKPVTKAAKGEQQKRKAGLSTAAANDAASGRDDILSGRRNETAGGDDGAVTAGIEARPMEAFLEDKYDGMRAQVHCGDAGQPGRVAIYSRNREDVTESFPELEEAFVRVLAEDGGLGSLRGGVEEGGRPSDDAQISKSRPFDKLRASYGAPGVVDGSDRVVGSGLILDGEILGWDLAQGRALPFAVLGTRIGRKRVSNEMRAQVPVVFMAFDLMYAEGELLLELPLRERRNRLEEVVERLVERVVAPVAVDERTRDAQGVMFAGAESAGVARLMISPSRLVKNAEDIDRAYAEARARSNEGVMLKAAGSVYQPGRRGLAWVKLKRELATLDVVVTGAEFGHGRRAGILSDYTFAVRGAGGELLNVGKAYSGLTDVEIAEMSAWMMEHTLEDQGFFRTVEPMRVLEVAFNNIMRSGRHASGFALRFPRILRIRTDKPAGEIDTVERVEEVYQSQVDKPVE